MAEQLVQANHDLEEANHKLRDTQTQLIRGTTKNGIAGATGRQHRP